MKVVVFRRQPPEFSDSPAWYVERLRADFPRIQVTEFDGAPGSIAVLSDAIILMTWWIKPAHLQAAKQLRWIQSPSSAVHQLLHPELVKSNILLTNGRDVHGPVVAEHALALILALAKALPQAMRHQNKHVWAQLQIWEGKSRPKDLSGATLGLIGVGSIGRNLAKRAAALGMKVSAVRKHPEGEGIEGVAEILPAAQLDRLLSQSDFVALAAPLTPATTNLMNAERLGKMRPEAYIINVARGALIDQSALVEALRENRIAGAALDVFAEEPLPADSPLWDLDNVLITPHTGGFSDHMWDREYALFADNLRRFVAGETLRDLVDKEKGY